MENEKGLVTQNLASYAEVLLGSHALLPNRTQYRPGKIISFTRVVLSRNPGTNVFI